MRRLGVSIYPEKCSVQEIYNYLELANKYGAKRIFSCLLSVQKSVAEIKEDFYNIHKFAKDLGFEIILDVSPKVFKALDISYNDLSFFSDLLADGIRLDMGFSGNEEALMTYNQYNLMVEINMSNFTHTIDTIIDYKPNLDCLCGCHNFYPHRFTGLDLEFFENCSLKFKKHGLRTACFIGCSDSMAYGPWPVSDGLCSLEMHRLLPMNVALKHLVCLGYIDDIIISNCFPSLSEWESLSKVDLKVVNFAVELVDNIPDVEKAIVLDELHMHRGDKNNFVLRSTQSRVKYKGHNFKLFNVPEIIKRGDIVIESSLYGHYAGELQIALKDMPNSGRSNVVGHIVTDEVFILDYIKPWQKFRLSL